MRVNLLRKSEVRYQGAVSRRFLVTTIITTTLLLLLLVSVLACMGWQARRIRIKRLLSQMEDVRPRVARVEELQAVVTHNTKTRNVLQQWRDNNVPWHGVLRDI
ncbi:MAG: hypothetical protein PHG65_09950, partial [Kiritimatiellae bacterium]|nr:hypothetical protein [Kiritimatiellia bacterium]